MYLKYGNYQHASGEVSVVISKQGLFSESGMPRGIRERWDIQGKLFAIAFPQLSTAINALTAAYSVHGQDVGFHFDNGLVSSHRIINAQTNGGVRVVVPPSFPEGTGAEYTTYRTYSLALEAELLVSNASLLHWNERLSFSGGGAQHTFLLPINGPPVKQLLRQTTTYRATQSGEAIGYQSYPTPAAPLWPDEEHVHRREVHYELPKRMGPAGAVAYTQYRVTWSYHFESATPLLGSPTSWPS